MNYKDALTYLFGLQKFGIKFGLNSTENLLRALGNPHLGRQYIHVAGTNGKGSVCSYLNSILIEAGYKVGFYSSPHLVSFRERFKINNEYITEEEVVHYTQKIKELIDPREPPTFFEVTTAMAIQYFKDKGTDIDILEVGMGGRLDATNVVRPCVSVITNISLEHRQYLGDTLDKIAFEKAGIIKEGVPVVTGVERGVAQEVILGVAKERGAPCFLLNRDFKIRKTKAGYSFNGLALSLKGINSGLKGSYQAKNLPLALATIAILRQSGYGIGETQILEGTRKAHWPGRFQIISQKPLVILDGAHNPGAMKGLKKALEELVYKRLILVIGIMADKEKRKILKEIVPLAQLTIFTRPTYNRAEDPKVLWEESKELVKDYRIVDDLKYAIEEAKQKADKDDLILITGSLFTVGEALSLLDPDHYTPDPIQ